MLRLGLCTMRCCTLCMQERAGIGAQLHLIGLALAIAMDTNRILLLDTNVEAALYTKDPYCGEPSAVRG
jgi:hypothetical protein